MTLPPVSRGPGSLIPSLAELLEQITADASLTPRQRQETCSALRAIGRAIGRRLEENSRSSVATAGTGRRADAGDGGGLARPLE